MCVNADAMSRSVSAIDKSQLYGGQSGATIYNSAFVITYVCAKLLLADDLAKFKRLLRSISLASRVLEPAHHNVCNCRLDQSRARGDYAYECVQPEPVAWWGVSPIGPGDEGRSDHTEGGCHRPRCSARGVVHASIAAPLDFRTQQARL